MKLVLSMGKTKIEKFTPSNFSYFPWHINFAGQFPGETNAMKSIGLQMESKTSWMPHINSLLHKLISICYMRRISHVLNILTLRSLSIEYFHSFVN